MDEDLIFDNLLFMLDFVSLGRLLDNEHILCCLQVVQLTETLIMEVSESHIVL